MKTHELKDAKAIKQAVLAVLPDSLMQSSKDAIDRCMRRVLVASKGQKQEMARLFSEKRISGSGFAAKYYQMVANNVADQFEVQIDLCLPREIEYPKPAKNYIRSLKGTTKGLMAISVMGGYMKYLQTNGFDPEAHFLSADAAKGFLLERKKLSPQSMFNQQKFHIMTLFSGIKPEKDAKKAAKEIEAALKAASKPKKIVRPTRESELLSLADISPENIKILRMAAENVVNAKDRYKARATIVYDLALSGVGQAEIISTPAKDIVKHALASSKAAYIFHQHCGLNYTPGKSAPEIGKYYGNINPDKPLVSKCTFWTLWKELCKEAGLDIEKTRFNK